MPRQSPTVGGDVQALPLGPQAVTGLQGRPVSSVNPVKGNSLVWNGSAWVPGGRIAKETNASTVTSSGTTFAGGADILTEPLGLQANGTDSYLVQAFATDWINNTAGQNNVLRLNLDGADAGFMAIFTAAGNGFSAPMHGHAVITPAPGFHTVNVRLGVLAASTATINSGVGGSGVRFPIAVTIDLF